MMKKDKPIEIISSPISTDDKRIDSRYRLAVIAAQRAKQLMKGSNPKIFSKYVKESSIALEELVRGKLEFFVGKEAVKARQEARRLEEEEARNQALESRQQELSNEIKQNLSVHAPGSEAKK